MGEDFGTENKFCSFCSKTDAHDLVAQQFVLWNPRNTESHKYMVIKSFTSCRECLDSLKKKLKVNNTVLFFYSLIIILYFYFHFSFPSDKRLLSFAFYIILSTSFICLTSFLHCSYLFPFYYNKFFSGMATFLYHFLIYDFSFALQSVFGMIPSIIFFSFCFLIPILLFDIKINSINDKRLMIWLIFSTKTFNQYKNIVTIPEGLKKYICNPSKNTDNTESTPANECDNSNLWCRICAKTDELHKYLFIKNVNLRSWDIITENTKCQTIAVCHACLKKVKQKNLDNLLVLKILPAIACIWIALFAIIRFINHELLFFSSSHFFVKYHFLIYSIIFTLVTLGIIASEITSLRHTHDVFFIDDLMEIKQKKERYLHSLLIPIDYNLYQDKTTQDTNKELKKFIRYNNDLNYYKDLAVCIFAIFVKNTPIE